MFIRRESFSEYIRLYPVTTVLIALNILLYLTRFVPSLGDFILSEGIGYNLFVAQGEWWRLVTPMFLHADFMHLLMNMFSLFILGPDLEKIAGKARFFTIFFLSGIFANLVTYFVQGVTYGPHLGASGAIFGLFGAFLALYYYTRDAMPELRQVILPMTVIGIVLTFLTPNINVTAHLGGLVGGFLIGLPYFHPKRLNKWRK